MSDLMTLRMPDLEWAVRTAEGQLTSLDWVETSLDPEAPSFRQTSEAEPPTFRQRSYGAFLPLHVVEAHRAAQRNGRPTAWDGLILLYARPEWAVAARATLWAPYSPFPQVLTRLAESFGIGSELHEYDGARLARLAAILPSLHASRGHLDTAREILVAVDLDGAFDEVWGQGTPAPDHVLRNEIMTCHSADWWEARQPANTAPTYRISDGLVRFQPTTRPTYPLRREDVLVAMDPTKPPAMSPFRLLPAWASLRITTTR